MARKIPVQQRSLATVETLLEAAAQVLQRDGEAGFTTNRVAAAAGFSIGTLYQYFPDKGAVLEALTLRECAALEKTIATALTKADPRDPEAVIRVVVRAALRAFGGRTRLRKYVIVQMVRMGRTAPAIEMLDRLGRVVTEAIAARGGAGVRPLSEPAGFVLSRSLMGAIRAAVLEERGLLEEPAFEAELVRLVVRFVAP